MLETLCPNHILVINIIMHERHLQAPHCNDLGINSSESKHQVNVLEVNHNLAWATNKSKCWYSCIEGIDTNQRCSHIVVMQPLH